VTEHDEPVVALIVAVAENGVIGRKGRMPWRIPSECRYFRETTMGKPVIMGRKTFDSLRKPLDGRDDIVVTRNRNYAPKGAIAVESVEQALKIGRDCAIARATDEIMIIGGAEIYAETLPYARRVYYTRIHAEPEGDVYFPELESRDWIEASQSFHPRQGDDDHDYTISVYKRRS